MSVIYQDRQYTKSALPVKVKNGVRFSSSIPIEEVSENSKDISPNKYYMFGEVEELTITLVDTQSGSLQEYMFEFISGTTPTVLNLPDTVKWITSNTIEANKTYQVSIVNNLAVMGGA